MTDPGIAHPFTFEAGESPLLVSIPHAGTALTPAVAEGLTPLGATLGDTDWHVPELYGFLRDHDVSMIRGNYSRYVVDLNRPADDTPLYSGPTTGLFPEINFDGEPLFEEGRAPAAEERGRYLREIWTPYHQRIAYTLAELRYLHGYALLLEAHSIRSRVPRLFDGRLPDLNLGTADGSSCAPELEAGLRALCEAAEFGSVVNGRFKGGYITRRYGAPGDGIHAVQLELVQANYMDETPPFAYRPDRAASLQAFLRRFVGTLLDW